MGEDYVTQKECAQNRERCTGIRQEDHDSITEMRTEVAIVKRMMWLILGVLIGGFGSVVFAIVEVSKYTLV